MKILLLGADGQVGYELRPRLEALGDLAAQRRGELDLADLEGLRGAIRHLQPALIVNAAAYNAVDRAEAEPEAALRINAEAVRVLGEEAVRAGAAVIHYSTDFVFDGRSSRPYTENDPPSPLSAYGRSKLAGEQALLRSGAAALVLRTAWVYSLRRKSFVSTMLELARERTELSVVTDQVGSPTFCADLARATVRVIEHLGNPPADAAAEARGVYHAAGGGACSRFELAKAALELDPKRHEHRVEQVKPATTSDFPAPAPRPAYAPLDCTKLSDRFGVRLDPWRTALAGALEGGLVPTAGRQ